MIRVNKESIKLFAFTAETPRSQRGDRFRFVPGSIRGKSKVLSLSGILMAAGLGLLENRPLTDSPEKTSSLSALCGSNEFSPETSGR
jgi:hypothetical protein